MATGNSVNDEIREQHGKMKEKTFKEKISYFWEYYKVHTLVTVLIILVAGNFIYTLVTRKDTALEIAFVNTYTSQDLDMEQTASDFITYAEIDAGQYQAVINNNMYIDYEGMDQYSAANMQKLMAMVAAGTLDVIITDDLYMDHNLEAGMFSDLGLIFSEEELEEYADRLLYKDLPDDGKGEVPVGIDVKDSKYLMSDQVPAWFTVVSNSGQTENAKKFLDFMLEP